MHENFAVLNVGRRTQKDAMVPTFSGANGCVTFVLGDGFGN